VISSVASGLTFFMGHPFLFFSSWVCARIIPMIRGGFGK
jgi:hypothetical protein